MTQFVRALAPRDVGPLSTALAELPLLTRYGRNADALEADLRAALFRGDGLEVYDDGAGPEGLAWFLSSGTFAMGGYLKLLAVLPSATKKGRGSLLLSAFEDATQKKSRQAFLLVSDFNHVAQRFYERHGYARVGEIPALVLPDVQELVYWKRLGTAPASR